ncbi:DUF3046 family protein [Homoserinimonas aerilata]|uniref:DUF3046 family protein n=1 Tax=Homoserinimonas aerilata TaxID=1162970 RepID=A0A542YJT3_9MICO|nr:DUF3046 domain-containing protein [Homoserinimonas aerilata]TQL48366.1 DUF3046 family protein [Homoserinimonas aerilata]
MRLSEFWIAMRDEFGAYGSTLAHDLVLAEVGGVSAEQALAAGAAPRDVWLAICRASDVPPERWHGMGRLNKA